MLRFLRKVHLYIGLFLSPALLFFAFTGTVQTLSLHEAAGSDYKPPAWLARHGQLHKKQTLAVPARKRAPAASGDAGPERRGSAVTVPAFAPTTQPIVTLASEERQHLPLKIFFVLVGLGLFTSTLTGIYMGYKYQRGKVLVTGLLLLGVVVPLLLLRF